MASGATIDATTHPRRTLAGSVSEILRTAILTGDLRPGTRLRMQQLAETYDLSMSTLREGLLRLAAEGLVVVEEQRGFSVAPVSRSQLTDLLGMRLLLEEQGLRLSIEHGDDRWEATIVAAFHALLKASEAKRNTRNPDLYWEACHAEFHRALIAACGSPLLLQMRDSIFNQGERYRHLYRRHVPRRRDHLSEHRALMETALNRDTDRAIRLMRGHLQATVKDLLNSGVLDSAGPPSGSRKGSSAR